MQDQGDIGVVRSFRLPRTLDEELRREAEEKGLSVNTLVVGILRKHVEWDRNAERFGCVSMTTQEYNELLSSVDEKRVREIAGHAGRNVFREGVLFWFGEFTLQNALQYIRLRCRYGRMADCELSHGGDTVTLSLHHTYCANHSLYLAEYLHGALEELVSDPEIRYAHHSLAIKIKK